MHWSCSIILHAKTCFPYKKSLKGQFKHECNVWNVKMLHKNVCHHLIRVNPTIYDFFLYKRTKRNRFMVTKSLTFLLLFLNGPFLWATSMITISPKLNYLIYAFQWTSLYTFLMHMLTPSGSCVSPTSILFPEQVLR